MKNKIIEINENTYLKNLIEEYPILKEKLKDINPKFSLLDTVFGKIMLNSVTLSKMSEKTNTNIEELIDKIKKIIEDISKSKG